MIRMRRKELKIRDIARVCSVIAISCLIFYISSIALSGVSLKMEPKKDYLISWDLGDNLTSYEDDSIFITSTIVVSNGGFYSVQNISIDAVIYTMKTGDASKKYLPDDTRIGNVKDVHFDEFKSFSDFDARFKIEIYAKYIIGLILYDTRLKVHANLTFNYGGIFIRMEMVYIIEDWTKLI